MTLGLLYVACLEGILVPLYEPKYCFNSSGFCQVMMIKKNNHGLFAVLRRKERLLKLADSKRSLLQHILSCPQLSGSVQLCVLLCLLSKRHYSHCVQKFVHTFTLHDTVLLLICKVAIGGPQSANSQAVTGSIPVLTLSDSSPLARFLTYLSFQLSLHK